MRQGDAADRRMHPQTDRQRRRFEPDATDNAVMGDLQPLDRNVFGHRARKIEKAGNRDAAGAHCLDAVVEDRDIDERAFRDRHQPAIAAVTGRLRIDDDAAILVDRDCQADKDKCTAILATAKRGDRDQITAFDTATSLRVDAHEAHAAKNDAVTVAAADQIVAQPHPV